MQLTIDSIHVILAKTKIVKNISMNVHDGQFVGIIGPNGCGKSTLLKSVYKALKPSEGTVRLDTMDILKTRQRTVAKYLSVVGQFNEIGFDFPVYEMVMMGRSPHKHLMETDSLKDKEIVDSALRIVNLEHLANRSFLSLSGGEKQRVILARAIAQMPHILILDEPTNHLDIKYQLQIMRVVKSLSISVLAALHDLQIAAEYCDYLYVMKQGELFAEGNPCNLLTKELIRKVYDVECETFVNPVTGKPGIVYLEAF
jgi:iron complex transport system ATP-binding protein